MNAPGTNTVYRWGEGRDLIVARPAAYLPKAGGFRVVARDTADRLYIIDQCADGSVVVLDGPVTEQQALDAADRVVAGVPDHGSVTDLVRKLAVGLVVIAVRAEAGEPPCA